jgi:hypothetical protein
MATGSSAFETVALVRQVVGRRQVELALLGHPRQPAGAPQAHMVVGQTGVGHALKRGVGQWRADLAQGQLQALLQGRIAGRVGCGWHRG